MNFYKDCVPILDLLAKRFNPNSEHWRENASEDDLRNRFRVSGLRYAKCHICNKIDSIGTFSQIEEHGIIHLKEYNLLPFI